MSSALGECAAWGPSRASKAAEVYYGGRWQPPARRGRRPIADDWLAGQTRRRLAESPVNGGGRAACPAVAAHGGLRAGAGRPPRAPRDARGGREAPGRPQLPPRAGGDG